MFTPCHPSPKMFTGFGVQTPADDVTFRPKCSFRHPGSARFYKAPHCSATEHWKELKKLMQYLKNLALSGALDFG